MVNDQYVYAKGFTMDEEDCVYYWAYEKIMDAGKIEE